MNKSFIAALYFSASLPFTGKAQFSTGNIFPGAVTGAYSPLHADLFSMAQNTASLSLLKEPALGIQGVRPYLINELGQYRIMAALPTVRGHFGIRADMRGNGAYRENQLGMAYARDLGSKLSLGLQFSYNSFRITGYGQASAPGVEAGIILHLTEQVHVGIQVRNPFAGKWGPGKSERLPAVYTGGIGYSPSPFFYGSMEVEKEEDQPVGLSFSLQYKPVTRFLFRAGMGSRASSAWVAVGFQLSRCRIDICSAFHPQLGITPGIAVLFHFKMRVK